MFASTSAASISRASSRSLVRTRFSGMVHLPFGVILAVRAPWRHGGGKVLKLGGQPPPRFVDIQQPGLFAGPDDNRVAVMLAQPPEKTPGLAFRQPALLQQHPAGGKNLLRPHFLAGADGSLLTLVRRFRLHRR